MESGFTFMLASWSGSIMDDDDSAVEVAAVIFDSAHISSTA
jgi:hypothetical protein